MTDDSSKKAFLETIEKQLRSFYEKQSEYGKFSKEEKAYMEGFMHAGIVMKLVTQDEMKVLMEAIYVDVFGMTPLERKLQHEKGEKQDIDWSQYDVPPKSRH